MKSLTMALCVMCLATAGFAASAADMSSLSANGPAVTSGPRDCYFTEKPVWQLDSCGNWVPLTVGGLANRARCWKYEIDYMDSCNKVCWPVSLKNEAAVAQWMIISMNSDGFHWAVRKPGDYVSDCVTLCCRSNYAIEMSCSGFDCLRPVDGRAIDTVIEVKYAFEDQGDNPPAANDECWCTPEQLNQMTWRIEDSYDLHWNGYCQHIWSTIHVSPCNGPTQYVDRGWATINCCLAAQQPWIDPTTGMFSGTPAFPFQ
jgi:hypothetical protein